MYKLSVVKKLVRSKLIVIVPLKGGMPDEAISLIFMGIATGIRRGGRNDN